MAIAAIHLAITGFPYKKGEMIYAFLHSRLPKSDTTLNHTGIRFYFIWGPKPPISCYRSFGYKDLLMGAIGIEPTTPTV